MCQRAGLKRFVIEADPEHRPGMVASLGGFLNDPRVCFIDSLDQLGGSASSPSPVDQCLAFRGSLVFGRSQLRQLLDAAAAAPSQLVRLSIWGEDRSAEMSAGPLGQILEAMRKGASDAPPHGDLPFALDGRAQDPQEAEIRLARSLRYETANSDGVLARMLDRKLSWRLSYRLARTAITPNQVTLANTALGFVIALMFASTSYWLRVGASLLFLVSVTLDGVDGELARLKMAESEAGGRLDKLTDNIVHVAVFVGLMVGCYRTSQSGIYLWLMALLLGGFALCTFSVNRAVSVSGESARNFIDKVERLSGRDFAYLLALLAILNWLPFFAWGAALGSYLFAGALWWITTRQMEHPTHA
jgi:phosphatidylglycerophosphate synthase